MASTSSDLAVQLISKIREGESVLQLCSGLQNTTGYLKLKKKIQAEISFLNKLRKGSKTLKKEHLNCSNLVHLKAVVECALLLPHVQAVLQPFSCQDGQHRIIVDIVTDSGKTWIKVIARNAQALQQISVGQGQYGDKSILEHAEDYIRCAALNPIFYHEPVIKFVFVNGISVQLSEALTELKVLVSSQDNLQKNSRKCDRACNEENECSLDNNNSCVQRVRLSQDVKKLNLDVTTMLAYVSSLTNGKCWFRFKEKVLDDQAKEEREKPIKPILDSLFEGRELICCQTAAEDFRKIVSTLAGPTERQRAAELFDRMHIALDCVSARASKLQLSSQVKKRSKVIFGSGDSLEAVTVTANTGFVRSAESQGVTFAVFLHPSRALTEAKESTATIEPAPEETTSGHCLSTLIDNTCSKT